MGCIQVLWQLIWLLLIIFIGFFVAGFCSFCYVCISPFLPCCTGCNEIADVLERGTKICLVFSQNMMAAKPLF